MRANDYDGFVAEFLRLSRALERFRQESAELAARADVYFHALKHLPLADLIAKADVWLRTETKFPKPADWAAVRRPPARADGPEMTLHEATLYRRAEAMGYEDPDSCDCLACVEADVSERPRRFVPEFMEDGRDRKVRDPIGQRLITAGHWAHGAELARWYSARAAFYAVCREKVGWEPTGGITPSPPEIVRSGRGRLTRVGR